ncbi:MAG TPA: hypothetical protein VNM92_14395 [Thermoanaerobaculia bacterium]|nr:hypothetical protein [Thermoanaerobaculia bacterium]
MHDTADATDTGEARKRVRTAAMAVADAVVSKGVAQVPEAMYGVGYVRISNSFLESWDWRMID